jgi:CRISPR-associated endonuclease Csn1
MKKILGLDIGISSIGWALINELENRNEIIAMGSRIIPLSTDEKDEFSTGNKISKNQKRTTKRTQRKGYDRYQLRRKYLTEFLIKHNMFDTALFNLKPLELWKLRANAVSEKISLKELGRVLYHLNQKRGYKSSKSDENSDKKETDYVKEVKNRYQILKEEGLTIGQKFYNELSKNEFYRIKQQVFPREAYIEEFDKIIKKQQEFYPQLINNEFINELRDEIIYYQRKLKSQKGLVSICEFEGFWTNNKDNKMVFAGPKVAPKSSPLFQVCKIWETINNLKIKNKLGDEFIIPINKKAEIFNYLNHNEKLSEAQLFKILELKKDDGWYGNKQIEKGLQGNITVKELLKYLDDKSELINFNLNIIESEKETFLVDKKTGEVLKTYYVSTDFEKQPLYKLWHTIYSIKDIEECKKALIENFKINADLAENLAKIDFTKYGFGNKSAKAIRKILPYLMQGYNYSDACQFAGYNHSNSLTKEEKLERLLIDKLPHLPKNSLRQPVVEKILNQLINVVNAIIEKHGKPDEIRIELARELKQSRDERNETFKNLNQREKENKQIIERLQEYGIRATRNNIIKWRLFEEISGDDKKINATCIYCGKAFGITDALTGNNVDVEHIIPKSLLFDDSQSNKTLSHRACNEEKGDKTAFDYMKGKGEEEFKKYIERVNDLYKKKIIGKAKRDKLLTPANKIPKDFIERQLRETQYIAVKAKEILNKISNNVFSTSGSITEYLRRIWGWDDVLMNLQMPKYKELELTEIVEWETNDGQKHKKEVIKNWSKRDDHRHHAIDALVIACTKQGFIQRINNLSSTGNREEMYKEVGDKNGKGSLLEKYLVAQKPFNTKEIEEKAAEILVSFKTGKKVATFGKRKIKKGGKTIVVQEKIIVPRGPLSEESVYGKIKTIEKNKPVKYLFENPELIFKNYIKELVIQRLKEYDNNAKKALDSLKKEPIYLDKEKTKILEYGTCFKEKYVIKYPIDNIKAKDVEYIVDNKIKKLIKERLEKYGNKEKEAFKEPIYFDKENKQAIKSVRMFTGLSSVEPVKFNENGKAISFVKPGNNHHIAFYIDENGKKIEHLCTFWHAVERKKYNLPIIIKNPKEVWNKILINKNDYPETFLNKLPSDKWTFVESLQQNEMFILGLENEKAQDALRNKDYKTLSNYIYRVQKISQSYYVFRHHIETQRIDTKDAIKAKRFYLIQSIGAFEKLNPIKIKINVLGEIIT